MKMDYHAGIVTTRKILDKLKSPDKKLKIIHIAGTNGKGSTAEYFTRILIAAGKRTGTFTSPAVYGYYEQFCVDGAPIPSQKFDKYLAASSKAAEGLNATSFEKETAAALYAFYKEGCEYAVVECGMGGLNDATNAIAKKELAVITSISLEHTEYLGDTVQKICEQKAGIINGCPCVINNSQTPEAREYFKRGRFADKITYNGGNEFLYDGKKYILAVPDYLQVCNAATAIEGAGILGIDETAVFEGIKSAKPRGRTEIFERCGRTYILDGAHNPAAFVPLQTILKGKQTTIIFGCLEDKDIDGNLNLLKGLAESIIAVACPSPRARSLEDTVQACKKYFEKVTPAESVTDALNKADTQTVAVCGSFTLLKEAKEWIEKRQ